MRRLAQLSGNQVEQTLCDFPTLAGSAALTPQISLDEGEVRAMQAVYVSTAGQDNLAVAAIAHSTKLNRRDSLAAIDEQQLVSLEAAPTYEMHNITVASAAGAASPLGGTFRVLIGGKASRPIQVASSAPAVAAAVRELLSNCEGQSGDEADSAGATFDCFQGAGIEYRGLAAKTSSGRECVDWRITPIWHPSLALTVGLESNLCRNPTQDLTLGGVWCYARSTVGRLEREACAVPRCGGNLPFGSPGTAVLATFEDEEDTGLARTVSWDNINGVVPSVELGQAYCGEGALYVPNSFARPRFFWRLDSRLPNGYAPYPLRDFPYICMAYRIPHGTEVNMWILLQDQNATTTSWRTLGLTSTKVCRNLL